MGEENKFQLKIIKIMFTGFIVKEMWLRKPWKLLAGPADTQFEYHVVISYKDTACLTLTKVAARSNPRRLPLLCKTCSLVQCRPSASDQLPTSWISRGKVAWMRYTSENFTNLPRFWATRKSQSTGIFVSLKTSSMEEVSGRNKSHLAFWDILVWNISI